MVLSGIFALLLATGFSCQQSESKSKSEPTVQHQQTDTSAPQVKQEREMADAATILARKEVPVLCYHHIRDPKTPKSSLAYAVPPAKFAAQMQALKDSGYQTILPDQLYDYLVYGSPLPKNPVMLTFDDTDEEQFSIGAKEMKKHGFKGVFFIMTVAIGKKNYMSSEQIKELAKEGNAIESHTWDHKMVTKYTQEDIAKQLTKPKKTIEDMIGVPARYFAYPYGVWNKAIFPELKKEDFKIAFALTQKRDSTYPLFTVRRMIVPGNWSAKGMINAMRSTFHLD